MGTLFRTAKPTPGVGFDATATIVAAVLALYLSGSVASGGADRRLPGPTPPLGPDLRIGTLPGSSAVAPVRGYDPATLIATWFGTGLLPVAPGTWGSLVAVPLGWGIAAVGGRLGLAIAVGIVFALGVWAAGVVIRRVGVEDPPQVVVDEVVGQWLALLAAPDQPLLLIAGFVLFRLFDIAKPWPVSWADRTLTGGFGAMFDDLLAGLMALAGVAVLIGLGVGAP